MQQVITHEHWHKKDSVAFVAKVVRVTIRSGVGKVDVKRNSQALAKAVIDSFHSTNQCLVTGHWQLRRNNLKARASYRGNKLEQIS